MVVAEEERQLAVVGADRLVAAAEVVVAGGLGGGGALGEGDLGGAEVEGGVGIGAADQAVAVGVVDVGGGLGPLCDLGEVSLGVPVEDLLVTADGPGAGVADRVVRVGVDRRAVGRGGGDLGQAVRPRRLGRGVLVGALDVLGCVAGGVVERLGAPFSILPNNDASQPSRSPSARRLSPLAARSLRNSSANRWRGS